MRNLTPIEIRVAIYVIIAALLLGGFFLWLGSRDKEKQTESSLEQAVRTDQAAGQVAQDFAVVAGETSQNQQSVNEARNTYQRGYEDAKRDDPVVVPWGARPVPQRLRDLARQRRLDRERSGCVGDGCGSADGAEGQ